MESKYYIRNLVGSFIVLCTLGGIVTTIFKYSVEPYEAIGVIFGALIMLIGLILVGYMNVATAFRNKIRDSSYLHCILVLVLFATDLAFGSSDLSIVILRNAGYFIALQFGIYLFKKINLNKINLTN